MASYTITEASKKTGKTKQTINSYIKSGKISATVDEAGIEHIDESELGRVFKLDDVAGADTVTEAHLGTSDVNVESLDEILAKHLEEQKA